MKSRSKPSETTREPLPAKPVERGHKLRTWAFRVGAMLLLPLSLLGGAEVALRLGGYGYPTTFFKPLRINGEDFLVENDKFGLRFFPPQLARSPAPIRIAAHKPPGTFRIFLFGESAALGDPRPAYGPGRYLQALLTERYPEKRFEVVCVAMTAINSHAVLPIARECAEHEGDLWIIYMGNNEFVGPFGATSLFGARALPWPLVRLNLALQQTRLGQWLIATVRLFNGGEPQQWGGMQMFVKNRIRAADRRNEIIYRNFRRNLQDILQAGKTAHVPILLNTVAVNLKDCSPFASLPGTELKGPDRAEWDKLYADGKAAQARGDLADAVQAYESAARLDSGFAELEFRLGQCYLALTNDASAAQAFSRARDIDALPFRATTRLDDLIAQAGRQLSSRDVAVFDAAAYLATNSPAGIPGRESFYEHVHLNFDGNYRLGRAWAQQIERWLPAERRRQGAPAWAPQEICERRLALTDWNRAGVIEDVLLRLRQPPLSTQLDNTGRMRAYQAEHDGLRQQMNKETAAKAREVYLAATQRAPDDERLHENFAEFLEDIGELDAATRQWQRVRELIPHHHLAWFQTGRLLARQAKVSEAEAALRQAVALRPDLSEGWLELGKLAAIEGNQTLALERYERARALFPQDSRVYYCMGKALSKQNRGPEAIVQLRQAVKLKPDDWEAIYALGEELAFAGQTTEAARHFQEVLRLHPNHAMAHLNLGVALTQQGNLQAAVQQFEETLRLDPNNQRAQEYLEKLRSHSGKR